MNIAIAADSASLSTNVRHSCINCGTIPQDGFPRAELWGPMLSALKSRFTTTPVDYIKVMEDRPLSNSCGDREDLGAVSSLVKLIRNVKPGYHTLLHHKAYICK
jgi:hypothetical protein